jgi:hypothetical protein
VTPNRTTSALVAVFTLGACRQVNTLLRAAQGPSAQQQHAMADAVFAGSLRRAFHDSNVITTSAWPESSLTVLFQDSAIVSLPDSARASLAHRVAEFVRDNYEGYAAVRRINVRFATSRFSFPAAALDHVTESRP